MATNEYDIASGRVKRRRGLVDALNEQALTQTKGQMVGQVYVGPGLLDALSKPLIALGAGYAGEQLDKEEAENSQKRQTALIDALSGMQPGTPEFTAQGLGSQFPELQAAGMKNLEAQLAPTAQEKFLAPVMTADGKLVQPSNRGRTQDTGYKGYVKEDRELKIIEHEDGTKTYGSIDANTGQTIDTGTPAYVKPPSTTNINNNLPKQESEFGKTMGKKDAERYDAANATIASEAKTADMIGRLKALESQPVLRGGLADLGVKVSQIGSTLGVPVPESVSNAEQANAIIQQAVVDFIKEGGRGITDEEGKRMVKTWPSLLLSPQGAKQVREQMEEINKRNVRQANTTKRIIQQRYPDAFPQQQAPASGGIKFLGFE